MRHLKRINELYEGPGKKIGFKQSYSEPKEEYIISIDMILDPSVNVLEFRKSLGETLKKCKVTENWFRVTKFNTERSLDVEDNEESYRHIEIPTTKRKKQDEEPDNIYTMAIAITAYHKYEASSALGEIMVDLYNKYGDKIYFDEEHVNLGGTDIDFEMPKRPGFELPEIKKKTKSEITKDKIKKVIKKKPTN